MQGTPGGRTRSVRRPFWLDPLSVRASFCVVALAIAAPEEPSSCPPQQWQRDMKQRTLSFVHDAVRPRLCAHLPLVYRSVRTVRTHDRPARHCVKARPSHRRSIACAALLSFAGAARRAQHIRRRRKCTARATPRSAGLHSHAPKLKPDGGTVRGACLCVGVRAATKCPRTFGHVHCQRQTRTYRHTRARTCVCAEIL